ncbi:MAG: nucleotidyltransferase domain-containing protein [Prevotellaceae bacterium]|nr:nucleotidyltransferase domain-containing protein [Candidatus Minthosoma caballi]
MSNKSVIQLLNNYFATQPVTKAWLFGSYSRGEQREDSDVDIIVSVDKDAHVGLIKFSGMKCDLEDLLKKNVDLVADGSLMPFAIESANRDKILVYERACQG